ncbi:MAG: hypothetical protein JJ966_07805 [Balneolaceae bacterium]|nr:hypothetical protein [Balneolaceae bacterium]
MVKYLYFYSIITVLILSGSVHGQSMFESGFYLDEESTSHSGYIDRSFLNKSPDLIRFKKTRKSEPITLNPTQAKVVVVSGTRLESYQVQIDTSAKSINSLQNPAYERQHVFLELIIEGQISLYRYVTNDYTLFFVRSSGESSPNQLIYKQFEGPRGVYNNNAYREQLDKLDSCFNYSKSIDDLTYTEESLSNFIKYLNDCDKSSYKVISRAQNHSLRYLNISAFTGIRWSSMTSTERITSEDLFEWKDFGLTNVGIELEYLLARSRNRLSTLARIDLARSYQSSFIDLPLGEEFVEKHTDYLYFSLSIRGYLPTKSPVKLYIDAGIAKPLIIREGISVDHEERADFEYNNDNLLPTFALGLSLYNRISTEARFEFLNRTITDYNDFNNIRYTAVTFNLKYALKSYYSIWDR